MSFDLDIDSIEVFEQKSIESDQPLGRVIENTERVLSFGITPHTSLEILYVPQVQQLATENWKQLMNV